MLDLTFLIVIVLGVILFKKKIIGILSPLKKSLGNVVDFELTNNLVVEEQKKNKKTTSYVFTIIGGFFVIFLVFVIISLKNVLIEMLDVIAKLTIGDIIPMDLIISVYSDTFIIEMALSFIQNLSIWVVIGFILSFVVKSLSITEQIKFISDKFFEICIAMHILLIRFKLFVKKSTITMILVTVILFNVFKHK